MDTRSSARVSPRASRRFSACTVACPLARQETEYESLCRLNTGLYPGLHAGLDPTRGRLDPRLGRSAGWIKSAGPSWSETRIKTRSRLSARHSPWSSRTSCTFRVSQTFCRAARATASYALQALAAPPPPPTPPCRPVAASGGGLSTCESRCPCCQESSQPLSSPLFPPAPAPLRPQRGANLPAIHPHNHTAAAAAAAAAAGALGWTGGVAGPPRGSGRRPKPAADGGESGAYVCVARGVRVAGAVRRD